MTDCEQKTAHIRALNDLLRTKGLGGQIFATRGVAALGPDRVARILAAVREFSTFESGNDPYGEHDFGSVEVDGDKFLWKIDYYDLRLEFGSSDSSDADETQRVLTVMLASEY